MGFIWGIFKDGIYGLSDYFLCKIILSAIILTFVLTLESVVSSFQALVFLILVCIYTEDNLRLH